MPASPTDSFTVIERSIAEIHAAMDRGDTTADALVAQYLARIDTYDDSLQSILTVNDEARDRAQDLDAQFERSGRVGPLHGIPLVLKDNHATSDMPTTAGSVALADHIPPRDAFVVEQLRDAGAIVLAKANLHELSFGVDTISSLGGETHNPYALDHRPSGSSGGTAAAVAANLATIGTGTDTCSSVRSPPAFTNLVGVRPTRGLISRTGVIPVSETQDTVGPITRTVADAARMLEVMAGYDPADPVTARGVPAVPADGYSSHLDPDGLSGASIGVARQCFGLHVEASGTSTHAAAVTAVLEVALDELAAAGATVVDLPEIIDQNVLESARVIAYEFARDVGRYLAEFDVDGYDALTEVYKSGALDPRVETKLLEEGILEVDIDSLETDPGYLRRLRRREKITDQILARMADRDLDALVYPPSTIPPVAFPDQQPFAEMNCELAAHTGLPAIVVPAGVTEGRLPVGIEFLGRPFGESRLFELAYHFEQATGHRHPPDGFGPV